MSDRRVAYTRYELLRTFRNRRFFFFSLGFPLVLYFADRRAQPQRARPRRHGRLSAAVLHGRPGLFGTMTAMLAAGARIASERAVGWNRQLRISPLSPRALLPREGAHGLPDGAGEHRRALPRGRLARGQHARRATGWR